MDQKKGLRNTNPPVKTAALPMETKREEERAESGSNCQKYETECGKGTREQTRKKGTG